MIKFESKAELTRWALEAQQVWLFLDYDGTLADFAPTPDYIVPHPEIIHLLERLAHKPDIRLTILSGRRLQHVRLLLPLASFALVLVSISSSFIVSLLSTPFSFSLVLLFESKQF